MIYAEGEYKFNITDSADNQMYGGAWDNLSFFKHLHNTLDELTATAGITVNSTLKAGTSTSNTWQPPKLTTTQRDALSAVAGMIIYNITVNSLQIYNGTTWVTISSTFLVSSNDTTAGYLNGKLAKANVTAGLGGVDLTEENNGANEIFRLHNIGLIRGKYKNLIMRTDVGGSPTTTLNINYDELVLRNSENGNGWGAVCRSGGFSPNITVAGANGLDIGAEALSTWYYVYIMSDLTNVISCLSISETQPADGLRIAYPYWALIGAVYNDAASDFVVFLQRNNKVTIGPLNVLSAGAQVVWTGIDISDKVPTLIATKVKGIAGTSTNVALVAGLAATIAGFGAIMLEAPATYNAAFIALLDGVDLYHGLPFEIEVPFSGNLLYYRIENAANLLCLWVSGWEYE